MRPAKLESLAAILLVGCGLFDSSSSSTTSETVTLAAQMSSGESGTATFTDLGNSTTQVAITTSGGSDTGVQSAVIRSGVCGDSGTIFAELNNLQGRQSITTLQDSLSSLTGGKYYVDVHSSTSINEIVACGTIQ